MSAAPIATAFAQVAECFRNRLALLRHGREGLTYGELHAAVRDLADRLREAGQGAGSRISLELEDGPEFVTAVWACWELGAAFVPLPPSLPNLRRHKMLRIVRPNCSIAAETARSDAEPFDGPRIAVSVPLHDLRSQSDPVDAAAETATPTFGDFPHAGDAVAYWIFTSGSTGEPKAVEVTHRGLLPMLLEQVAAFGLQPNSRVLRQLSILFDANLSDLGTALLAGATLCFENAGVFASADRLRNTLISRRITHWDVPPSLLPLLANEPLPPTTETLVCGGEPADPDCVRRLAGQVRFVNVYGPTEATICTSLCRCDETWSRPLLGRPIAGNIYRICASDGTATADGEPGELWISGPGLANGYRDRPDLTSARFPTVAGRRWFRTGDRVRRTATGETEFLGRFDRQFKRRGRLICPEEIEAALASHPAVGAAYVFPPAGPGLVAVWEMRDPHAEEPTLAELGRHLRERLPEWMIPTRLRRVPRLPRTASGKVDPAEVVLPKDVADPEPTTETPVPACEILRAVWREVLEVEAVPLDAEFADLGGDSVSAVLIAAKAAAVGVPLDPADLFRLRTVRACVAAGPTGGIVDFELEIRARSLGATLPAVRRVPPRRIPPDAPLLLTGATGQFGGRLLRTLLRDTTAPILVLLRESPGRAASDRWEEMSQRLMKEGFADALRRIVPVAGDVARPNWGLPADTTKRIGRVIHAAAELSLARGLEDVLPTNAASFLTPAGWAIEEGIEVHLISTLAVFVAAPTAGGTYFETPLSSCSRRLCGCYAQSKWVAERAVAAALVPAVPLFVHRFSLLANLHESQPLLPDQLALWLAGLSRIGCLPPTAPEQAINLLPVDMAAELFVGLVCGGAGGHDARIFHWATRENIGAAELLAACRRRIGTTQAVSEQAFQARLAELPADHDAAVGLAGLGFGRGGGIGKAWEPFLSTGATFDVSCTEAALRTLGRALPTAAEVVARLAAFHSAPAELR